jgi:hypothetical protein
MGGAGVAEFAAAETHDWTCGAAVANQDGILLQRALPYSPARAFAATIGTCRTRCVPCWPHTQPPRSI